RLQVADEPGVLASLAGVLAERGVSIASLRQPPTTDEKVTQLIITTHPAPEAALSATVAALDSLASVQQVISVLPVLDA
ncbi:MAG: ACT domain-containing protein, partial [Promicromonosporaceae bacterium]|nr:ACT domain-containing protein [Promicromonosporaceae bacterium]